MKINIYLARGDIEHINREHLIISSYTSFRNGESRQNPESLSIVRISLSHRYCIFLYRPVRAVAMCGRVTDAKILCITCTYSIAHESINMSWNKRVTSASWVTDKSRIGDSCWKSFPTTGTKTNGGALHASQAARENQPARAVFRVIASCLICVCGKIWGRETLIICPCPARNVMLNARTARNMRVVASSLRKALTYMRKILHRACYMMWRIFISGHIHLNCPASAILYWRGEMKKRRGDGLAHCANNENTNSRGDKSENNSLN